MRSFAVLVALAATAVTAQVQNYTSSLNMTIDPNSVPLQLRATWCQAQTNTCDLLCNADAKSNDCDSSSLKYDCTCSSNSSAPALQYYTQTIPTFICQALFSQCIEQNAGNQKGQTACTNNIQDLCGGSNPPALSTGSTSASSPSKTSASNGSPTKAAASASGTASSAAQSETHSAFAGPTMAPVSSGAMAVVAAGLFAYLL